MNIDLVVAAPIEHIRRFGDVLSAEGLYVPEIRDKWDQFNVLDTESQWKADIIRSPDTAFGREEFARRQLIELLPGIDVYVATVEDVILAKLQWAMGRDSPLQLRDVRSMIDVNRENLDLEYLRKWADDLGGGETLEQLLREKCAAQCLRSPSGKSTFPLTSSSGIGALRRRVRESVMRGMLQKSRIATD